ncbi:MAG TPA: DinB family protein [Chitinophagaceae bacterium]|nr:DinB family protein [Chitinophagaceae bacterium]
MANKDAFIAELNVESASTQKILERVPIEKASWKPHEKSMTLGRLATHVADIPHWISRIITVDDWDFAVQGFSRHVSESQEELLNIFQEKRDKAIADLGTMNEEDFNKTWIVRNGDKMRRELPKKIAIRSWGFSHLVHHRGQLSVYLRLLDVPVPGMYGPSADEM